MQFSSLYLKIHILTIHIFLGFCLYSGLNEVCVECVCISCSSSKRVKVKRCVSEPSCSPWCPLQTWLASSASPSKCLWLTKVQWLLRLIRFQRIGKNSKNKLMLRFLFKAVPRINKQSKDKLQLLSFRVVIRLWLLDDAS